MVLVVGPERDQIISDGGSDGVTRLIEVPGAVHK